MREPARKQEASRRSVGRPAKLSVDEIVRAATDLIDEEGAERLSVRAVAQKLGVTPMALYNHVRNRDELEDLIAQRISAERRAAWKALEVNGWRDALSRSAQFYQEIYASHPELAHFRNILDRSTWNVVGVERLLADLKRNGLTEEEAIRVAHVAHLVYRGYLSTLSQPAEVGPSSTLKASAHTGLEHFPDLLHAEQTARDMDLSLTAAIDFLGGLVELLVKQR